MLGPHLRVLRRQRLVDQGGDAGQHGRPLGRAKVSSILLCHQAESCPGEGGAQRPSHQRLRPVVGHGDGAVVLLVRLLALLQLQLHRLHSLQELCQAAL